MLHVLWPFLWIWAMAYKPERGWGFGQKPGEPASPAEAMAEFEKLKRRLAEVEARLEGRDHPDLFQRTTRPGAETPAAKDNAPAAGATRADEPRQQVGTGGH